MEKIKHLKLSKLNKVPCFNKYTPFSKKNLTQRPEKDRKHIASTFASSILCTVFLIIVNKVLYKYLKAELYGNHFKSSTLLF